MRRFAVAAAVLIVFNLSCALIRPKPAPYPEGLVFPLTEVRQMSVDGIPSMLDTGAKKSILTVLRDGRILAVHSNKDDILWSHDSGHPIAGSLVSPSKQLFAVGEENTVHSLGGGGRLLWKTVVEGTISTGAVLFRDRICVGTQEGRIVALEAFGKGEIAWTHDAGSPIVSGPEAFEDRLFFMTEAGRIHALDPSGRFVWSADAGGRSSGPLLVDKTMAYFGTDDRTIRGFDLERRHLRWGMKVGGHVAVRPQVRGNTLYVLTTEGVLYAMMAHRGDILWWRALPSRSIFGMVLAGDNIFVSCRSPLLTAFNARTGEKAGEFTLSDELVAEALWMDPRIVIPVRGPEEGRGRLVFLQRDIRLTLAANKPSPQEPGQEISFTATAVGLHGPRYTFFLKSGAEDRRILQAESDRNTLAWFPDREGAYTIEVQAKDERLSLEAKTDFEVKKPAAKPEEKKEKKT